MPPDREETTGDQKIQTRRTGNTVNVVFDNPGRHNAMSLAMWERLSDVMAELAADPKARVVVLSGAGGKAFVSGADISEFESQRSSEDAVAHYNRVSVAADAAVYNFPKPTIAKIKGYCIGGGLGLAIGCDLRICSEDARFAIPAAKLGLGYDYAGVKKLVDVVGPANAAEICYSGRMFTADDALRMGLVNQVLPNDALDATVEDLAETISNNAPLTLAAFKAALRECAKTPDARDMERIARMVEACYVSNDYTEGRQAFMEKRQPVFKGH
jgi:enoyl-CoA hydratase/carnithine racemase